MWKMIKGWFVNDVRVVRQQVPMNRKQRRVIAAMKRKRRKSRHDSVS